MSAATCIHGMPSPASCLTCMEDEGLGAPPVPPVTVEYTFVAAFDGRCDQCNDSIEPGDTIAKLSDGTYVCEECAS